jgi:Ser/Thr protein kinase RdoA (MazF antagonist)
MRTAETERRAAVEGMLGEHFGRQVRVAHFERRPFAYQTSSAIDWIDVTLDDGTRLDLLLKDLSRAALQKTALRTKPDFLHEPLREIEVYRTVLVEGPPGPALSYGAAVDADEDRYWLLLERVGGRELYQIGERPLWHAAAQWLARMHCQLAGRVDEIQRRAPLLHHDADFYRVWLTRAIEFETRKAQPRPRRWQRLVDRYDLVIERLVALPKTFIHGEFYASNVLVEESSNPHPAAPEGSETERVRVCPVDWEMAAVGPGLMDMAALTAGRWTDEDRTALLNAYLHGLEQYSNECCSLTDLQRDLDFCRLQMAVQWLGWSPDWTPPAEHTHDWLAEAMELAEKVEL